MANDRQKIYTLYVRGMHCESCVVLTESELKEHPKVFSAESNLMTQSVEIKGDFGEMAIEDIARELAPLLSRHSLSTEKQEKEIKWKEFGAAVPVALSFAFIFVLLQKLGIVNLASVGKVTYGAAFLIGVAASLSSCMAVVGGLVLAMSATFAREGDRLRPQVLFHGGRIVSFSILGGVIGTVGSVFQLGAVGTATVGIIIGLVMFILGVNLLDVFHFAKRFQPSMPKFLSRGAFRAAKINHTLTPALVGIATFFLPCGFTQSMQIYALSTGSFLKGGLTMLFFALGTFPVLALISFSSFSVKRSSKAGIFFKSAGLIVILFAVFNIINSLVSVGWMPPVFNF